MTDSIGIIGCGWLGFPLAKKLISERYTVNGTTTSESKVEVLRNSTIRPYLITLSEKEIKGAISEFLNNSNILIINVPPGLRGKGYKESYVKKMHLLYNEIKKTTIKKVIFISSTSVYGDISGKVTEETIPQPSTESGKQLLISENIFREDSHLGTSIIRFGGLIGTDRHPITMLSGRKNLKGGNAPVNLIHLEDCIGIISSLIKENLFGDLFNGVHPDHPTKKEYYTSEAVKRNIEPPIYQLQENKKYKEIHTCNLFLIKKYAFLTTLLS